MKIRLLIILTGLLISTFSFAIPIKVIKFATEANYPPFTFLNASGVMQGFDIDVAKALCSEIQAACTFNDYPFDKLISGLKKNEFDAVIAAMEITDVRKEEVAFTDEYYINPACFIAYQSSNIEISSPGLQGKTVGVQVGSNFASYLRVNYGEVVKIKTYSTITDALSALKDYKIDAVLANKAVIQYWLQQGKGGEFVAIDVVADSLLGKGDGIAVAKTDVDLLNALNQALAKIKADGTLARLEKKYFND